MAPEDMTDEQLQTVIETGVEPEPPESTEEETPEVTEEPEVTEAKDEEKEEPQEEEKPPSRREQLRIQQLLAKYGEPGNRQAPAPSKTNALDYNQSLDADPEVIRQLEADRQANIEASYNSGRNEGLQRAEFIDWRMNLKMDAPTIHNKYPILDKESPEFHPAVADALNSWYLKMVGYDPENQTVANSSISYADFIESNMEMVEEIASQKNVQSAKNIVKQAAATGLRPDGSSAKRLNLNQSEKDMNLDELYAAIGQTRPKK